MRWFEQQLPDDGSVTLRNVSVQMLGFQIAGPRAQELLQALTSEAVDRKSFGFFRAREINFDLGTPALSAHVQRVSYTGDDGFEIYVQAEQQASLYDLLTTAGKPFRIKPFGMRAMMSLRLEKSFGSWMREFKPDYGPLETGLSRFVDYDKTADFIGKAAARKEREAGATRKLCTFKVAATDADVWGDEPIWHNDEVVGFVTSGGYAHHSATSVAIGFLPPALATEGREVEIEILGERIAATLYEKPLLA